MKTFISLSATPTRKQLITGVKDLETALKSEFPLAKLSISVFGSNLYINVVVVHKDAAGQGVGKAVIKRLIDFANSNYLTLQATPASKEDGLGTTSKERLLKFYKGLGFRYNMGHKADYELDAGCVYIRPNVEPPTVDTISHDLVSRAETVADKIVVEALKAKYTRVEYFVTTEDKKKALDAIAKVFPPVASSVNRLLYPVTEVGTVSYGKSTVVFVGHLTKR